MKSFKFYFSCKIGERLLGQMDNLSRTLQSRDLSAMNAISLAEVVIKTLENKEVKTSLSCFGKKSTK